MRTVIIHYHLFKNAGTSLDRTLKANFGEAWAGLEGGTNGVRSPTEVGEYLKANPSISVVSSHRARLPPPAVAGVTIFPVLFLRHPMDRLLSVYAFERKQKANTFGANLAKITDFAGYITGRLDMGSDRAIHNFQTDRLQAGGVGATELDRALDAVAKLPFVGIVEDYDRSLERLQALLVRHFRTISLKAEWANVRADRADDLDSRLAEIRDRLPAAIYDRALEANADDLRLWEHARQRQ